jgi:DNA repair exonuclease SbcCD ATPase subunit
MAKLVIPQIPGVKDFTSFIAFLGDKDAYTERVRELQDIHEKLEQQIEDLTHAQSISAFQSQALERRKEADTYYDQKVAEAQKVLDSIDDRMNAASDKEAQLRDEQKALGLAYADLDVQRANVEEERQAVANAKAKAEAAAKQAALAIEETQAKLDHALEDANLLKQQYEEKLAKFKAVVEG